MPTGLEVRLQQASPVPLEVELLAPAGAVTALFGPSGSGKTTVLRTIAGLHAPARVRVCCAGETWTDSESGIDRPAHRRPVGFLFQDYALFPHLTLRERRWRGHSRAIRRCCCSTSPSPPWTGPCAMRCDASSWPCSAHSD